MPYNDEIQKRTAQFAADGMGLAQEAAIARCLLQESLTQNTPGQSIALLNIIPKITAASLAADIRAGNVLTASSVMLFARGLVAAVCKRLEEAAVPNREAILDGLMGDVQLLFAQTKDRQLLTHEKTNRNQE